MAGSVKREDPYFSDLCSLRDVPRTVLLPVFAVTEFFRLNQAQVAAKVVMAGPRLRRTKGFGESCAARLAGMCMGQPLPRGRCYRDGQSPPGPRW